MFRTTARTPPWRSSACARAARPSIEDPLNRRFHAEPNACPDCGPSLALLSGASALTGPLYGGLSVGLPPGSGPTSSKILERARSLLREGHILAIKGLGGFHLVCDATNESAVSLLRERKRRSGKAFAIMVRTIAIAERICILTDAGSRAAPGNPPAHRTRAASSGIASGNERRARQRTPRRHAALHSAPSSALRRIARGPRHDQRQYERRTHRQPQ